MPHSRNTFLVVLVVLAALAVASIAVADFACPSCNHEAGNGLGESQLVGLVLSTLLHQGIAVLFLVATGVVSLPWLVAGMAVAAFHLRRWIKVWW